MSSGKKVIFIRNFKMEVRFFTHTPVFSPFFLPFSACKKVIIGIAKSARLCADILSVAIAAENEVPKHFKPPFALIVY